MLGLMSLVTLALMGCGDGMQSYAQNDTGFTADESQLDTEWTPEASETVEERSILLEVDRTGTLGERRVSRDREDSRTVYLYGVETAYYWETAETTRYHTLSQIGFKAVEDMRLHHLIVRIYADRDLNVANGMTASVSPKDDFAYCFALSSRSEPNDDWMPGARVAFATPMNANGILVLDPGEIKTISSYWGEYQDLDFMIELKKGEVLSLEIACSLKLGMEDALPPEPRAYTAVIETPEGVIATGEATGWDVATAEELKMPDKGINIASGSGVTITPFSWLILE